MYLDSSEPPLDLLRSRKQSTFDPTGKEIFVKDLTCCGIRYKNASSVNTHYTKQHSHLPPSDPVTWSHITIKNAELHAEKQILLPFKPFPSKQAPGSTWTTQIAGKIEGSREARLQRRKNRQRGDTKQILKTEKLLTKHLGLKRKAKEQQKRIDLLEHRTEDTNQQLMEALIAVETHQQESKANKDKANIYESLYQRNAGAARRLEEHKEDLHFNTRKIKRMEREIKDLQYDKFRLESKCDRLYKGIIDESAAEDEEDCIP
jgi:hypothetical protein